MKYRTPRILPLIFSTLVILRPGLLQSSLPSGYSVQTDYQLMTEPLTTEKVSVLDPQAQYPQRHRWIVSRHVELMGLETYQPGTEGPGLPRLNKGGLFGVQAKGLISNAQGYVKNPGPGFQDMKDFSCSSKPDPFFETLEGAKSAAALAASEWADILDREKFRLPIELAKIKENSQTAALEQGERTFKRWLASLEPLWRTSIEQKVRNQEWKSYELQAKKQGICPRPKGSPAPHLKWRDLMESPAPSPLPPSAAITQILARAPARIWDGYYSIRVDMEIEGKKLNGKFLIDAGAHQSVISPAWLESQGIYPLWVIVPKTTPKKVTYSQPWPGAGSLASIAEINSVSVGKLSLGLHQFLLKETDFFDPPNSFASCCDGVLGRDFLRLYPMEFQSGPPSEVIIWSIEKFHPSQIDTWFEESEIPTQDWPYQGDFAYDLPHDRIWISTKPALEPKMPPPGLELGFQLIGGERVLKVKKLVPGSLASKQLSSAGLKPGVEILQVDGTSANEMDLYQVNQHLNGKWGPTVVLEWKTPQGKKMGSLQLSQKKGSPQNKAP
jgi:hypothetical protein